MVLRPALSSFWRSACGRGSVTTSCRGTAIPRNDSKPMQSFDVEGPMKDVTARPVDDYPYCKLFFEPVNKQPQLVHEV